MAVQKLNPSVVHIVYLLLAFTLLGGMVACRTRQVPGSVTPDAVSPVPLATITPVSYPGPEDSEPLQPSPTPFTDTGTGQPDATPVVSETAQAEVPPVATEPPPMTETPVAAEDGADSIAPTATLSVPAGFTPGSTVQHVIGQREWLLQIARCYGTSYDAILSANRVPNPNLIMPGSSLNIPAIGSTGPIVGPPCVIPYTVQPGDTWEGLAQQFGTSVSILQRANPGPLIAGTQIWVPRTK